MSAQTPTLQATIRDRKGTRYARRLRAEGRLPAVIYGQGNDPKSITLDHIETVRHLQSGSHVFEINFEDSTAAETCLVKDCLLYTSPSPRDRTRSRMPSSA